MSKPLSPEELSARLITSIRYRIDACEDAPGKERERLENLALSILGLIDGSFPGLPSMRLVARPCPLEIESCKASGQDWTEVDTTIQGPLKSLLAADLKANPRVAKRSKKTSCVSLRGNITD